MFISFDEKKKLKDNISELFSEIVRLERRIAKLEGNGQKPKPETVDTPAKPSKLSKPPKPTKPRMQLKYPHGAVVKFVRPFLEQAVPDKVHTVPVGKFDLDSIQSCICNTLKKVYPDCTYTTTRGEDSVSFTYILEGKS